MSRASPVLLALSAAMADWMLKSIRVSGVRLAES